MRGLMMAGALALMAGGAEAATYSYTFTTSELAYAEGDAGFFPLTDPLAPLTVSFSVDSSVLTEPVNFVQIASSGFLDGTAPDPFVYEYFVNNVAVSPAVLSFSLPFASPIGILVAYIAPDGEVDLFSGTFDYQDGGAYAGLRAVAYSGGVVSGYQTYEIGGLARYDTVGAGTFTFVSIPDVAAVPLPASAPMIGLALAGLFGLRRRATA